MHARSSDRLEGLTNFPVTGKPVELTTSSLYHSGPGSLFLGHFFAETITVETTVKRLNHLYYILDYIKQPIRGACVQCAKL